MPYYSPLRSAVNRWNQNIRASYQRYYDQARANYYTQQLEQAQQQQRAKTEEQEARVMGLWDEVAEVYKPGGEFGKQTMKELTAAGTQRLVGAGLYSTTASPVSAGQIRSLEDLRSGRYAEALRGKAGAIERIDYRTPDYGMFAQLMQQAWSGGGFGRSRY